MSSMDGSICPPIQIGMTPLCLGGIFSVDFRTVMLFPVSSVGQEWAFSLYE